MESPITFEVVGNTNDYLNCCASRCTLFDAVISFGAGRYGNGEYGVLSCTTLEQQPGHDQRRALISAIALQRDTTLSEFSEPLEHNLEESIRHLPCMLREP